MHAQRPPFQIKLAAVKRLIMWHLLNRRLDLILITEFPRSGGSWFGEMMSKVLQLPFPRNVSPPLKTCIMHGHHLYHPNFGKMIAIMRDGRDVIVSAYYHFLFENDRNPPHSIKHHRSKVNFKNYEDIRGNMPDFISYMFEGFSEKRTHFNWSEGVHSYCGNPQICVVKYEDLLQDAAKELQRCIDFLGKEKKNPASLQSIVEDHSFKKVSKRKPGEENKKSFMRKGIAGDWKNHFTKEACERFEHYAGAALIKAGYEKDQTWIRDYVTSESY